MASPMRRSQSKSIAQRYRTPFIRSALGEDAMMGRYQRIGCRDETLSARRTPATSRELGPVE
jgi:hypothetical protein